MSNSYLKTCQQPSASILCAIVGLLLLVPMTAISQQPSVTTPSSVRGLVRDIACPLQNNAATSTDFDLKCVRACARKGSPLIIQTKEGLFYTPISSGMPDTSVRQRLLPFVGKQVIATGTIFERNGTRVIAIQQIKLAQ